MDHAAHTLLAVSSIRRLWGQRHDPRCMTEARAALRGWVADLRRLRGQAPPAQFRTHTGEIVNGARLQAAIEKVADWYAENARAIRREDGYAAHVTEATKEAQLAKGLAFAEQVRSGAAFGFSVWQRINTELTGECVALLSTPKEKTIARYDIVDKHTGAIVGKAKTRTGASRSVDRRDNAYGGYRYTARPVYA